MNLHLNANSRVTHETESSNCPVRLPASNQNNEPDAPFGPDHTPYDAIGGDARVRELVDAFDSALESDKRASAARATYPEDLAGPRQRLYEFLCGWLGGPQLYVQKYGHPRLRMRHARFVIGERERDQWLLCMGQAMDQLGIDGPLRTFLDARFSHVADFMRNS